jgi:hypothetical protein
MANKYLEQFLQENSKKPFITNLKKYNTLNWFGKLKVVSSFYTHLIISAEMGVENKETRHEVLSILTNLELFKIDKFLDWLKDELS